MSARTAGNRSPARAPHPKSMWRNRFLLAVPAVLLLLVGFEVGIRLVTPDTVQVTVSVAGGGRMLATREIADALTVADLYTQINGLPSVGLSPVYHCGLPGPDPVAFGFRYTRWGLPVEVATLPDPGCAGWWISRGGLSDGHDDPNGETRAILSEVQPLACPQAWLPQCQGY